MQALNWWRAVKPHQDICEGRVNEALFAANLGRAVQGEGPQEYCDAEAFFAKTYLTRGLRELLVDILRVLSGRSGPNPVVNLQTSFGGGKTHTELAIYHLLQHPDEAARVEQVRALLAEAGLEAPPPCRVAVFPGSSLNPLGRTTQDGVVIRTLWGEMAYQLGGRAAYDLLAANDAQLVSPGEEALAELLRQAGPCVMLFDETQHYVDKASTQKGPEGDLAKQTVAFLRELTAAVDMVPRSMLVVSLTATGMEQLSPRALDWLERMDKHVNRVASARTPIASTEIHEIVRQRLFEQVDEGTARETAARYHALYAGLGGLPASAQSAAYQELLARSYPFHPELVTVLYERWGSKPGFQLTRGTLRFLALALQHLWAHPDEASPDLIQPCDLSLAEDNLRATVREVAGDAQWESVLGSDIVFPTRDQMARAQLMDEERGDGQRLAEGLATTILLYSLGGGENPCATRQELRLACSRPDMPDALCDDLLDKFRRRLFYYYFDEAKHQFRKEPNVLSLQQTYRTNLQDSDEVAAYLHKTITEKALGAGANFAWVKFMPEDGAQVPDDDGLKLVAPDLEYVMEADGPSEAARKYLLDVLSHHGQVLRQYRNRVVFCLADAVAARTAEDLARDYLSWRKIQRNPSDWDRIGGAQQALVKEQLEETESATLKALIGAYAWAAVPTEDPRSGKLDLQWVSLGGYRPGKLIAPLAWERLTSESGQGQYILASLTAETLLQRYGPRAWPESETWVTTIQLWERFTRQVGLPMLVSQQVLLDTLRLGQREGFLAIGHLNDESSPRDQRDSYLDLYYKEKELLPNVPGIGERWVLLRPAMYHQVADQPAQVSPVEIKEAVKELNGGNQPVRVSALYKYVKGRKQDNMDEASFYASLDATIKEKGAAYRVEVQGADLKSLPADKAQVLEGFVVEESAPQSLPSSGRTIMVRGQLRSLSELASLYKNVLQLLSSQGPQKLNISLDVSAQFDKDPGAGFDASLAEGFKPEQFPGLTLTDSKAK